MVQKKIVVGDLLYHAVHGLCRIASIITQSQSGKKALCYSLVPKTSNKSKMRFIINIDDVEASGFHTLVSLKEAKQILKYLRAGDRNVAFTGKNETWDLAQIILSSSHDKIEAKDQRRRQALERSVKGLLGELAFVFNITLKETAARIEKNLGNSLKVHPLVATTLAHAVED